MRADLAIIGELIRPDASVLDLGCGDGTLLANLRDQRGVRGYGLEINEADIAKCVQVGVNVIHADLEAGLSDFDDDSFDYVVMTQTLQAVHHTERLLEDMMRVGREGIVTFPNFGYWKCRLQLGLYGRMPVSKTLPHEWYNTPNVHLFTIRDFEALCHIKAIRVLQRKVVDSSHRAKFAPRLLPNLFGELALYRLGRR